LLAGTYVVYNQINYMKEADLKIDVNNIIVLESPPESVNSEDRENTRKFRKLMTALESYPQISKISSGGEVPGEPISWNSNLRKKNQDREAGIRSSLISMSINYPDFFEIDIVAGRELREGDSPWRNGNVVINERLSEMLGFETPEDALGEELEGFMAPMIIRGVVENHHHTSLHADFEPIAYIVSGWVEYYFVKLDIPDNNQDQLASMKSTIAVIEKEWNTTFPDYPFDYFFLDSYFNEQYKEDERFGKLFSGFSGLAIIIACLGLFGLTAFTVQQRTKEIGIRKVLGASVQNLLAILSKEYLILVTIASVLSLPLAWWVMEQWLADYTFRIQLGIWFVVLPIMLILVFAVISIVGRVLKAAYRNPVEALRYE
ncbi:MAG: FtsX-like permease family protein, partial [Bacteroidota bacterium]